MYTTTSWKGAVLRRIPRVSGYVTSKILWRRRQLWYSVAEFQISYRRLRSVLLHETVPRFVHRTVNVDSRASSA